MLEHIKRIFRGVVRGLMGSRHAQLAASGLMSEKKKKIFKVLPGFFSFHKLDLDWNILIHAPVKGSGRGSLLRVFHQP